MRSTFTAVAALLAAALPLEASTPLEAAETNTRDLALTHAGAPPSEASDPDALRPSVWFDHADRAYVDGEAVTIFVASNKDAYVTVLDIGPTGDVVRLFPNASQPESRIRAWQPLAIGTNGARVVIAKPFGDELIKVIVSSRPLDLLPRAQIDDSGPFAALRGGSAELGRNLALLPDRNDGSKVVIRNIALRTLPGRQP